MSKKTKSNTPSKERKYFAYEHEGDGFTYFSDEKERDEFAEGLIQEYLQDGWGEGVESIMTGTIDQITEQTNIHYQKDQVIDEEGCDQDGFWWDSDWDYICNYELTKLDA